MESLRMYRNHTHTFIPSPVWLSFVRENVLISVSIVSLYIYICMLLDYSYKSVVKENTPSIFALRIMNLLLCFVVHPLRMNFWEWILLQTLVIRSGLRLEGFFGNNIDLWNLRLLFCFLSLQNWCIRQSHHQCPSFLESITLSCLKGGHK